MKLDQILDWSKKRIEKGHKSGIVGYCDTPSVLYNAGFLSEEKKYFFSYRKKDRSGNVSLEDDFHIDNDDKTRLILDVRKAIKNQNVLNDWKKAPAAGHGGKRKGAGRHFKYDGPTKVMRVPASMVDDIKEFIAERMST